MAIKTSTLTATTLALTSGSATTTLTKDQLDSILAGGGGGGSSGSSQFTSDEVSVLKKLAGMPAIKTLANGTAPTYIMTSGTLAGVEQVSSSPGSKKENTFYIVMSGL